MTPGRFRRDHAVSSSPSTASVWMAKTVCLLHNPIFRSACRKASVVVPVLLLLCLAAGCGTGINGISGGSIPSGNSRLAGRVVAADNVNVSIPNATVRVVARLTGGSTVPLQATTDSDGHFDIQKIPTGQVTGDVQVTVTPPDTTYQPLNWSFAVKNGHAETLLVTLPRAGFDVTQGVSVSLMPTEASVRVGDTIQFTAHVLDRMGAVLPVAPTLLFDDSFGILNPDGTFTSGQPGAGFLVAFWYGNHTASAHLTADEVTPTRPPPPPVLTPPNP